jgi:hypothetical protein
LAPPRKGSTKDEKMLSRRDSDASVSSKDDIKLPAEEEREEKKISSLLASLRKKKKKSVDIREDDLSPQEKEVSKSRSLTWANRQKPQPPSLKSMGFMKGLLILGEFSPRTISHFFRFFFNFNNSRFFSFKI